ncbi:PAS domain-containing protein [Nostoc sp. UHCC 0252]|uniref:PAS domain-containing protein n=1 Tax=Nostoc sp. UHCC 0252 TaxID=3110241 RepID=UPI002B1FCB24|nr:PAS domain-containing protein [Nostoc sp. UHCC 0252]MEA5604529.1 PAS domain-containing protein [Nostoc sp. UHCC 0252]
MTANPITVFFVEDSSEDTALYRRFLEWDDRYTYDIYEFESGNKALQVCLGKIPDVILLDYRLPDLDGLEFLTKLQKQTSSSQISVIMLTGQGDETIAVQAMKNGADDYLVKGKLTQENFCRTIHGAIKHKQLMQQLEQQQEQQRLVGAIALHIRKSLQLSDILTTSVQEVRQLLSADRVLVYQFTHLMHGCIVSESVLSEWQPSLGLEIEDTCFQESQGEKYRQGKIWTTTNIYEAGLSECHLQLLEQFQVKANLVVPILVENIGTLAVELWGLFIVHQCSAPRQWQTFEVELLKQLTVQLAIAIQQAQLYHNLQNLNTELEAKVQERTAKLQESDRRFRAIFDNTFQFTGLLTPSGILLEANQTALSFGGLQLEDVIDRPFWEAHWWTISPQTQEELKQAIAHAAKGEFVRYEVDVLGANNRVATIDFSLRPLQDETGKVVLLIPEGRDITERKATELALSEREVMLHLIGDNLPNGAVYRVIRELDGSDRFSYLSAGIEGLTEVKVEDALRDSSLLYRQFIPEDIGRLQAAVEESRLNLSVFDIQLRIQTPSEQLKWLHFRSTPRQFKDGRVAWDGLVVDVTDLKRNEETLCKSQALLEESQRVARLGNWEFELASGKISWSKGLFDLFNREPALLEPNYEENLQLYHPEDGQKLHQAVERAIATGESYKQILRVPQNGSNRYFEGIGHAEFNADGEVIRLYGTAQDVTEREIALRDRQKAEERLQLALEASGDGLWDWNILTGEIYYSPRFLEMLGYSFDELPQDLSTWERLVHPDDLPWVKEILAAHLKDSSVPYKFDYRFRTKSGEWKWIANYGKVVIEDEEGNPLRMTGTHRDVSDIYDELRLRKQTEAALAKSEEQLRLTLEFNHIGIWDWNVETGEVIWNNNHFRLLGLEPETSASYQLWRNCVHLEDVDRIEQAVLNALAEHSNFEDEYRVIYPDGSVHWLTGKGRGVCNEAGEAVRMLGVIIDISDRKILERELAHKQKLLDTFINSAPVGITIMDRDLRFSFINEALAEINGIPVAAHIGKTTWEIVPDLASKQEQIFRHLLTTGEPILDLEISGETPKLPGVIRTWLASYFPIQSETDEPISIGIVVVEISDRKRAEQMLELQAVITRNMAEGICLARIADGVFVYANPKFEQMFGYEPGELIGKRVSIVNRGDEHTTPEEVNQAITATVIQHGEATYEVHNVKKDGTPFWCRATSSIFEHPEYGTVLVAVQQDITEHKQAEEKIKASLKEKEVLLKEIHHRVKNNLGIVSSLLQMQCRRTQDPVVTAILRDSQNRIASIALVHEKLYRSEDLSDIDFAQYIPDLTTHLFDSYNVSSSQIQLNIQVDDASLDIETAIPCGLIINELVSNALKYAFVGNRGGKIEVKFYQESESTLTLIIRDNGIGLPENFDSRKAKTLGITLVQGLVKQLRGKLEIESHQGTQFKITFTNSRI